MSNTLMAVAEWYVKYHGAITLVTWLDDEDEYCVVYADGRALYFAE